MTAPSAQGPFRRTVQTAAAPAAIGPYSQAVVSGGWVFLSGQLPLVPATGEMVSGDVGELTHRVMANIQAVLEASGSSLDRVVKTTVYLTDLADFAAMNTAYATYFSSAPPARSTVQVAALPRASRIEIDVIASV